MADIADQHDQASAAELDESHSVGNGAAAPESRGIKRQRPSAADDDDDDEKGGRERRKIEIKFISDKSRRHITFSKRKAGIMKKVGSVLLFLAHQTNRTSDHTLGLLPHFYAHPSPPAHCLRVTAENLLGYMNERAFFLPYFSRLASMPAVTLVSESLSNWLALPLHPWSGPVPKTLHSIANAAQC
jgi:hypothetical protein